MRILARFMHFYSAYTFQDVMEEKAVIFFSLLDEMYRIHAIQVLEQANIVSVPHTKDADRFLAGYRNLAKDLVEEIKGNDYTDISKLKGILNNG